MNTDTNTKVHVFYSPTPGEVQRCVHCDCRQGGRHAGEPCKG